MRKTNLLILITSLILSGALSYGFQSKPSLKDIQLTSDIEELIEDNTTDVLFLFGIICVGGCPIGNYIHKIKDEIGAVFILPPESTLSDISNFKRGLKVKGKVIIASEKNVEFVKSLAQKMELEDYKENIVIEFQNKKIINIKRY